MLWLIWSSPFHFWDAQFECFGCPGSQQLLPLHRNYSSSGSLVLSCLCSSVHGLSGTQPFFICAFIAFFPGLFRSGLIWDNPTSSFLHSFPLSCLFSLFRSRLIWDSSALSFLYSFSISSLCCLDPGLTGTVSPFRFFTLFRSPVCVV